MATAEVPQEAVVEGSIDEVIDLTTSPISVPPAPQYTSQGYRPPRIQKPPMHDRTTDRHYYVPPLTLPRNTNINDHIDDLEIIQNFLRTSRTLRNSEESPIEVIPINNSPATSSSHLRRDRYRRQQARLVPPYKDRKLPLERDTLLERRMREDICLRMENSVREERYKEWVRDMHKRRLGFCRPESPERRERRESYCTIESDNGEVTRLTCSICLESLSSKRQPTATRCGHIFCATCLTESLHSFKRCPNCKATVPSIKTCTRLYF